MDWPTLANTLIASLSGIVVGTLLTAYRERRQHFQKSESDRLLSLEERVGLGFELALLLPRGAPVDSELTEAMEIMKELRFDAGRFGRYASLASSLRQFHNSAMWLVRQKREHEDTRTTEKELRQAFSTVLQLIKELR